MCMPLAGTGAPNTTNLMLHANFFAVGSTATGPRGRTKFASPHWIMADLGHAVDKRHYLNAELMLTFEKWTFPRGGYPLLLQEGESNKNDVPYIDAQHPHSSPIMGLTLSDTIRLNDQDFLKIFFAPRGQSSSGPIAFMHRTTGMVNPDAPLGHHVGQDVGHITSTVIGSTLKLDSWWFEASAFHGEEPEPMNVDLPLGVPNSGAFRLSHRFSNEWLAMASAAYVKDPEAHHQGAGADHVWLYSATAYGSMRLCDQFTLDNTFIVGLAQNYSGADSLVSVGEEFAISEAAHRFWGRIEALERTPGQLAITSVADRTDGRWVGAATLGYSRRTNFFRDLEFAMGVSGTKNILPKEYLATYGGNPWTAKVFVQIGGMGMWRF